MNKNQKIERKQTNQKITFDMTRKDRTEAMRHELAKRRAAEKLKEIKQAIAERKAKGKAHYLRKMGRTK